MKPLLCLFLLLATPLWAKTPPKPVAATPAPAVSQQPAVPMARQRTVEEDDQLRIWITDIQTTAQDQLKRADAAESEAKASREQAAAAEIEAKASRDQTAIADAKLGQAVADLVTIQKSFDAEREAKETAQRQAATEKARADKEAKESARRGNILGWLGGALLAALFSHLLFLVPAPYKAIGVFALPLLGGIIGYFLTRILI